MLVVQVVQSILLPNHRSGPRDVGPPQKVISEGATLHGGQSMRYDFVLTASASVKIDVRATPTPVAVKLLPTEAASPPPASKKPRPATAAAEPVFWNRGALTVIQVEALSAGKWTLLIERAETAARNRGDTVITTNVSVL